MKGYLEILTQSKSLNKGSKIFCNLNEFKNDISWFKDICKLRSFKEAKETLFKITHGHQTCLGCLPIDSDLERKS